MTDRSIPVWQLIELLPDDPDFDVLKQAFLRVSVPDPQDRWSSASSYRTLDRRAIPVAMIGQILSEAEGNARRRLKRIFDAVTIAFAEVVEPRGAEHIQQLIAAGEAAESSEEWRDAVVYYSVAERLAQRRRDPELQGLTLRRAARAYMHAGDYARSARYYASSYTLAAALDDQAGLIIAAMGMGNVVRRQGRWVDAESWDLQAYRRCDEGFARERAQVCVNLSITARERGSNDEADEWLEHAHRHWDNLTTTERTAWWTNHGLVRMARGEFEEAKTSFERALADAASHFHRAMILDNLAELALRQQCYEVAEAYCREAEEHALAVGTPRVLAEIYMRLGRLCRFRGDSNGVVFFEKAIELGGKGGFPLLYGTILYEYGLFRKATEDFPGARDLFVRALEVFSELGALTRLDEVQAELV